MGPSSDRKPHVSDDTRMESTWQTRLTKAAETGGSLYDGYKFRLHCIQWDNNSDGGRGSVHISMGLTSYKEYVGTNQLPSADRATLEADGVMNFGNADAHLSNALGCETVLVTHDAQVVLLRRSDKVGSGTGLYNGPSGHPEPGDAGLGAHGQPDADVRARNELFHSIIEEVHAETNLPKSKLSAPLLIGAMCDASRKPDILFFMQTKLTAEGVRLEYARGGAETWESDRLAFCPADELNECELPLTSVTRAAIACVNAAGGVDALRRASTYDK